MDGIIVSGNFLCFPPYIGQNIILTLKSYLLHNFCTLLQCLRRPAAEISAAHISAQRPEFTAIYSLLKSQPLFAATIYGFLRMRAHKLTILQIFCAGVHPNFTVK